MKGNAVQPRYFFLLWFAPLTQGYPVKNRRTDFASGDVAPTFSSEIENMGWQAIRNETGILQIHAHHVYFH